MIHWKISALSIALGATATLGFVWLGARTRNKRRAIGAADASLGAELPAFDADDAARADAFHDLDLREGENGDLEFGDPDDVDPLDEEQVEVQSLDEEASTRDEPYDAVDPESIGVEFLRRATESPSTEAPPPSLFDAPTDVAVELPVGRIDADGATELHEPRRGSGGSVELPPTEDELARRAAEPEGGPPDKPNG
ncbi:MAG TPA: hypothetical protein VFZ53_34040 [Polyangiaceae bacterium]